MMTLKEMVQIVDKMKKKKIYVLDVSKMSEIEACCITSMLQHRDVYNFYNVAKDFQVNVVIEVLKIRELEDKIRESFKRIVEEKTNVGKEKYK